jgi:hypothetical protein
MVIKNDVDEILIVIYCYWKLEGVLHNKPRGLAKIWLPLIKSDNNSLFHNGPIAKIKVFSTFRKPFYII